MGIFNIHRCLSTKLKWWNTRNMLYLYKVPTTTGWTHSRCILNSFTQSILWFTHKYNVTYTGAAWLPPRHALVNFRYKCEYQAENNSRKNNGTSLNVNKKNNRPWCAREICAGTGRKLTISEEQTVRGFMIPATSTKEKRSFDSESKMLYIPVPVVCSQ